MVKFSHLSQFLDDFTEQDSEFYELQDAIEGDEESIYRLGQSYMQAEGIEHQFEKAYFCLNLAVESGVEEAKNDLAVILIQGIGCETNVKRGKQYLIDLAEADDVDAQHNLAYFSYAGKFLPRDKQFILKYASMASEQGEAKSEYIINSIEEIEENDVFLEGTAFSDFIKEVHQQNDMPDDALYEIYSQTVANEILENIKKAEAGNLQSIEVLLNHFINHEKGMKYWYQKYIDFAVNEELKLNRHLKVNNRVDFEKTFLVPILNKMIEIDYEEIPSMTRVDVPVYVQKILNLNSLIYQQILEAQADAFSEKGLDFEVSTYTSTFLRSPIRIILSAFKILDKKKPGSLKLITAFEELFKYILALMERFKKNSSSLYYFDFEMYKNILFNHGTFEVLDEFKSQLKAFEEKVEDDEGLIESFQSGKWDFHQQLMIESTFFEIVEKVIMELNDIDLYRRIIFSLVALNIILQASLSKDSDEYQEDEFNFMDKLKAQQFFLISSRDIIDRYRFVYDAADVKSMIIDYWKTDIVENINSKKLYNTYGLSHNDSEDFGLADEDDEDNFSEKDEIVDSNDIFEGLDVQKLTSQTKDAIKMYHEVSSRDPYKNQINEAYAWLALILEDNSEQIQERFQEHARELSMRGILQGLVLPAQTDKDYQEILRTQSKHYDPEISHFPEIKLGDNEAYLNHALAGCEINDGVMTVEFKVRIARAQLPEDIDFEFYDSSIWGSSNMTRLGHVASISTDGSQEIKMKLRISQSIFDMNIYFEYDVPYGFIKNIEAIQLDVLDWETHGDYYVLKLKLATENNADFDDEDDEFDFDEDDEFDFDEDEIPKKSIKVIKKGTKHIEDRAFYNHFNVYNIKKLILPEGLKSIGDHAFEKNQISCVNIPEGLERIGKGAFRSNQLTSLVLPNSLTKIDFWAFAANELTHVVLPENLLQTSHSMFFGNKLTTINLPSKLNIIGVNSFRKNLLKTLIIPPKVESIYTQAFEDNQLESITIPASVQFISKDAFKNNPLKKIIIEGDQKRFNDMWEEIGFPRNLKPH